MDDRQHSGNDRHCLEFLPDITFCYNVLDIGLHEQSSFLRSVVQILPGFVHIVSLLHHSCYTLSSFTSSISLIYSETCQNPVPQCHFDEPVLDLLVNHFLPNCVDPPYTGRGGHQLCLLLKAHTAHGTSLPIPYVFGSKHDIIL